MRKKQPINFNGMSTGRLAVYGALAKMRIGRALKSNGIPFKKETGILELKDITRVECRSKQLKRH
ncbi:hypothetical protein [Tenacibaculum maritimum]|uniref:hypothetical protein n=1 Tax=Tenacibaculum maritimum TaxID=107401 RepID=UPI001F22679D|nr:hypothetical protein [Tenacibaculum maritimum]